MENLEKEVEMHDGVKMILERMKSHPEEFTGLGRRMHDQTIGGYRTNKWGAVIDQFWYDLTEYEQAAITVGLREANRDCFLPAVMRTILTEQPKYTVEEKISYPTTQLGQNLTLSPYANQSLHSKSSNLATPI